MRRKMDGEKGEKKEQGKMRDKGRGIREKKKIKRNMEQEEEVKGKDLLKEISFKMSGSEGKEQEKKRKEKKRKERKEKKRRKKKERRKEKKRKEERKRFPALLPILSTSVRPP